MSETWQDAIGQQQISQGLSAGDNLPDALD